MHFKHMYDCFITHKALENLVNMYSLFIAVTIFYVQCKCYLFCMINYLSITLHVLIFTYVYDIPVHIFIKYMYTYL